jgi:glycerol kinase
MKFQLYVVPDFLKNIKQIGWHEHDPLEIWFNVVSCMEAVQNAMTAKGMPLVGQQHQRPEGRVLAAIGITNQRETTIAWNAQTGIPYYNAIVWDDLRTTAIASQLASGNPNRLRAKTGLPCASYFAGTKVKWLLDNVRALQRDLSDPAQRDQVRFGTIDTWLLYQLTGQRAASTSAKSANVGGLFYTDVSNASRWLLCDIGKVQWDVDLIETVCGPHSVPLSAFPTIQKSSQVYAACAKDACRTRGKNSKVVDYVNGVPVASILGDQQAALFGQCAYEPGEAKNTYGTGMFLMMNTGTKQVPSEHGLLTTIAYQITGKTEEESKVHYALEGSVSHSGSTIQWLRDQLQIIDSAADSETAAQTTSQNDGMYFVPAFAGLFAPHWRSDARACMVGMTASHHRGHVCRAALEAAAYQAREVFDAIHADSRVLLKSLKVDGGGTHNQLLMQFQADIINVPVVKPVVMETTSMGAAFAAGLAVGVWDSLDEIRRLWNVAETYEPTMSEKERQKNWAGWQKAVEKSMNWVTVEDSDENFEDALQGDDKGDSIGTIRSLGDFGIEKDPKIDAVVSSYSPLKVVLWTVCAVAAGFLLGQRQARLR